MVKIHENIGTISMEELRYIFFLYDPNFNIFKNAPLYSVEKCPSKVEYSKK